MPYHVIDKTADQLTDNDIRELRIVDNQTNAETEMNLTTLEHELADLSFEGFDFDFEIESESNTEERGQQVVGKKTYQIIVDCDSEEDLQEKYNTILEVGIECRISSM